MACRNRGIKPLLQSLFDASGFARGSSLFAVAAVYDRRCGPRRRPGRNDFGRAQQDGASTLQYRLRPPSFGFGFFCGRERQRVDELPLAGARVYVPAQIQGPETVALFPRQRRKNLFRRGDAFAHHAQVKTLVGGVQVVLGQEKAQHHRIEAKHALDLADDRHAAALAQI